MAHVIKRLLLVVLLAIVAAGCATTSALRSGERAEFAQDYDLAVAEYTKALQSNPDNRSARQGLQRSKLRAAENHYSRGRQLTTAGRLDEALVELQMAGELNPADANVQELLTSVRTQLRTKIAVAREGKTQLETLIERAQHL